MLIFIILSPHISIDKSNVNFFILSPHISSLDTLLFKNHSDSSK
jgi:hypothetical protein